MKRCKGNRRGSETSSAPGVQRDLRELVTGSGEPHPPTATADKPTLVTILQFHIKR